MSTYKTRDTYEHKKFEKQNIKNDTYEYRKFVKRPNLDVKNVEIGICTEKVLKTELKKTVNGRFYYTPDTNKFWFDWNGKRTELNVNGGGGGIDPSEYAKKSDVPKMVNDILAKKNYITETTLDKFLKDNHYITQSALEDALLDFIGREEFESAISGITGDITGIRTEINDLWDKINSLFPESESESDETVIEYILGWLHNLQETVDNIKDSIDWDEFIHDSDSESDSE